MSADILTLNVGCAGAERAVRILEWLRGQDADTLVLTETSAGQGSYLIACGLRDDGYRVLHMPHPRDRGVLVASRRPCAHVSTSLVATLSHRVAALRLREAGCTVLGVYIPSRDRSPAKVERKRQFVTSLLRTLESLPDELRGRIALVGDFNMVARDHVPKLSGFFDWEYDFYDELERLGFRSAHADLDTQPHSWIGRTGTGYLYDYVQAGADLAVERCTYLHSTREARLSDHAAVSARLTALTGANSTGLGPS